MFLLRSSSSEGGLSFDRSSTDLEHLKVFSGLRYIRYIFMARLASDDRRPTISHIFPPALPTYVEQLCNKINLNH